MTQQSLRIGLDFDNTIVCYDKAIAVLAEQMLTLPANVPRSKIGLRNHLRAEGRENEWTTFQGALYGPGMEHAQPFKGAIETMQALKKQGHELFIVSHRSRIPYAGPPYDLHAAAKEWVSKKLHSEGLFSTYSEDGTCSSSVNFLDTRDAKVSRIAELNCQMFVDDLPEVLEAPGFPETTVSVLFAPQGKACNEQNKHSISSWTELPSLIAHLL
jgi:hypothetical protein